MSLPVLLLLLLCGGQRSDGGVRAEGVAACRCDAGHVCDCTSRNLTHVPWIPLLVEALDLSHNRIAAVTAFDLVPYVRLTALSLRGNRLRSVAGRAFRSLGRLERLDLSANQLASLNADWFTGLLSLTHLNLLDNPYRSLGPWPLFQGLLSLRSLQLGGPSLEKLQSHDLSGVGRLDVLELHANHLRSYDPGSLSGPWPLGTVTLSLWEPFLTNQTLAEAVLDDVSYPETPLTLCDLQMYGNASARPFAVVARRRVRSLMLKNTSLSDQTVVDFLEVTDGAPLNILAFQDVIFVGEGHVERARKTRHDGLDTFYLRNMQIVNLYRFSSLLGLGFLLRYPRQVTVIGAQAFVLPCLTSSLFTNLQYFDLSNNLLTDLTLAETLCHGDGTLRNLRVLNVSSNAIKSLDLAGRLVTRLDRLTHLDLSGNVLASMPGSCSWPASLRFLNISSALLRMVTPCLPSTLEVLDLSHNDLRSLDVVLPRLKQLLLSGNKLLTLPPSWKTPSLELLVVSNNALSIFSPDDLQTFGRLRELQAGGNNFLCSCSFVAFMATALSGATAEGTGAGGARFTDDHDSYVCDSPLWVRGEKVGGVKFSLIDCHRLAFVASLCGVSLLAVLLLAVLLRRLHVLWYLRMMWAWLAANRSAKRRRRRHDRKRLLGNNDIGNDDPGNDSLRFDYDAFVSYSEQDAGWVEDFLVPELEENSSSQNAPQSLCLHKRDFLPGKWIVDNILIAMENSRRTIFVLSSNFVKSDWCRYELEFSHLRMFQGDQDEAAILVLLEPLGEEDVPRRFCRLRKMMSSRTFLLWPQDEQCRDEFWNSLRAALNGDD
uniref:Toll-like receptor 2 n=1 Tax=Plecoglossus altivelis TaxID=61084 RepID=A0A3R5VS12_PLEAT|nr:toll-like receptor 2 [Plecoglossus altivelis]